MTLHARPRRSPRRGRPIALLVAVVAFVATVAVLPGAFGGSGPSDAAGRASGSPSAAASPIAVVPGIGGALATEGPPAETAAPNVPGPPATPSPSAEPIAIPADALQARLDAMREKLGIPGASATMIFPDGSTWTGTSGLAVVREGVAVEPDTAFAIASISKTYTSALVLALAEDGLVDLDAPAATYLPGLPLVGSATVRQLLDHTSGLRDFFLHPKIDARLSAERSRAWSVEETLGYVRKAGFTPGTGWSYSNTNYVVLAALAESVGGRPLAAQLRERFLDPLGLAGTWEQVAEAARRPVAHGYLAGGPPARRTFRDLSRGSELVPFTSVVTAAHGTGSIAATSPDVARWARALYGGEVLEPATVAAMIADARQTAKLRAEIPYGLGVQLVDLDGHPALGHSGRLAGFRSVVRHLPGQAITIAVLTNESKQDPARIARALLRVALRTPPAG